MTCSMDPRAWSGSVLPSRLKMPDPVALLVRAVGRSIKPLIQAVNGTAVDPACYIDFRDFGSYDELDRYLASVSDAHLERYRLAGRDYLASEQFRQFSPDAFADRFIADIEAHLRERGLAHLWR